MSREDLLDEAIAKAKAEGDRQLVEWLRMARGGEAASRWYTAKLKEVESENAKLREELAQWERLTADIELPEYPVAQFRPKDLESENAKLRELLRIAGTYCVNGLCGKDDGCPLYIGKPYCALPDRMRELGVEVD